jgi:isochorismate pyruvate lyase
MRKPADCTTMADIRAEIDRLDEELVRLFAERAGYIDRAAEIKAEADLPARIDTRVEEVVGNVRRHAEMHGLPPDLVEKLWRRLIDWSIAREENRLGPTACGRGEDMAATIIDGKAFAARVRGEVAVHVARLKAAHGIVPGLAVVLVGEDPASQVYVRSKGGRPSRRGWRVSSTGCPTDVSEAELLEVVARLNATRGARDPRATAAARAHERRCGDRRDRPGQGRGRVPHLERGAAGDGAEGDGALHAAGLSHAAARPSRIALRGWRPW